ncbi:MFS transporter [Paraburkholderia ferrariae]|uniref:MFS transporter n=1 Tax=Paraburkholderia ferrariae TaxID=386056 RepID=UPI0005A9F1D5|nr:MFS transporter [Paraburkholderia ferrariae]
MAVGTSSDYSSAQRLTIIVSCILGFALDLYDVLILPYLMPSIQHTLGLSLVELASVTTVTLIGSVIGGALFGWLGDRIGRRTALQLTLGVFALASVASAFAWSYGSLAALRFATGVGLGGEWGAGMVLFNETWNPNRRGLGSALIQAAATIATAGASIVGLWLVAAFTPEWSWRLGFLSGGSPVVLMIAIRFWMPESRAWQASVSQRKQAAAGARLASPIRAVMTRRLTLVAAASALWMTGYMFCYYAIVVFLPTLMLRVLKAPPDVVRETAVTAAVLGGVSYLVMGWCNDRFGRRFGAVVPALGWVVCLGLLYATGGGHYEGRLLLWPMFWIAVTFSIGNSAVGVVGAWLSELFPIEVRSTLVSSAYMIGRAMGSLAPILVPLVATARGGLTQGMLVAAPAAALFLVISLVLPETRGNASRRSQTDYAPEDRKNGSAITH